MIFFSCKNVIVVDGCDISIFDFLITSLSPGDMWKSPFKKVLHHLKIHTKYIKIGSAHMVKYSD